MSQSSDNNKRIAKNTLFLYIRMFIMMAVSLYTSRVVLQKLGVEDFGLYNIVGGIVVLFSILNSSLASATQRFLNFELGKGKIEDVNKVFQCSITLHLILCVIILLLSETVGLWYINHVMNVPEGRLNAANLVYHFSVITFCVNLLRVPFHANIIAHERMSFYAYVSIIEAFLKLGIVYLLMISPFDRLVFYAFLVMLVTLIINVIYVIYNKYKYSNLKISCFWEQERVRSMLSFSGWSLFGSLAVVSNQQGINLVLNYFCGVALNAAAGVAGQVTGALYGFISNFQVAFNPQIIKLYAQNKKKEFFKFVFRASKVSYLLLFLLGMPVYFLAPVILKIWLVEVPEHTVAFCRIIILYNLVDALNGPLWTAVNARGKIKSYQILMSSILLLNIPFAYVMLEWGFAPESVWLTRLFFNIVASFARMSYLKHKMDFPLIKYIKVVLVPLIIVSCGSVFLYVVVDNMINSMFCQFVGYGVALLISCITAYCFAFSNNEKQVVMKMIGAKFSK